MLLLLFVFIIKYTCTLLNLASLGPHPISPLDPPGAVAHQKAQSAHLAPHPPFCVFIFGCRVS